MTCSRVSDSEGINMSSDRNGEILLVHSRLSSTRSVSDAATAIANALGAQAGAIAEVHETAVIGRRSGIRLLARSGVRLPCDAVSFRAAQSLSVQKHVSQWRADPARFGWAVEAAGAEVEHLYPVFIDSELAAVVVLKSSKPLASETLSEAAVLIGIYATHLSLLDYAQRDTLTGVLGLKTFSARLAHWATASSRHALREGVATNLAIIDIDGLGEVNQRFGHVTGNAVMAAVAGMLRESVRLDDEVFRIGSDEFAVILTDVAHGHAVPILGRLRAAIECRLIPPVGRVTVSIGSTEIRDSDLPAEAAARADRALRSAKEEGRNRVVSYENLAAMAGMPAGTRFRHVSSGG